uniref:CSON000607 protein n=1 Tax=Culicoides sonorensis TaxID=179676 RepID=A0A336MEY6_CULSO
MTCTNQESDTFMNRLNNFESKLLELENMLLRMCRQTEDKIDQIIDTLNDIHTRVVSDMENFDNEPLFSDEVDDPENAEKETNNVYSESDESDYESLEEVDR